MARLVEANEVDDGRVDGVVLTNDGVRLAFSQWGADSGGSAIILLHGWSGSRHYFTHSVKVRCGLLRDSLSQWRTAPTAFCLGLATRKRSRGAGRPRKSVCVCLSSARASKPYLGETLAAAASVSAATNLSSCPHGARPPGGPHLVEGNDMRSN